MDLKTAITETVEDQFEVRPVSIIRPSYHHIFKKHGVLDGKLFHAEDKVTYTFVAKHEVISLHFDRGKNTVFYKGHNVANLELGQVEKDHLDILLKELEGNADTQVFVKPYKDVLSKLAFKT